MSAAGLALHSLGAVHSIADTWIHLPSPVTDGFSFLSFSAKTMDIDCHHSCRIDHLAEPAGFGLVVVFKKKTNKNEEPPKPCSGSDP